jgi:hypothetical protein
MQPFASSPAQNGSSHPPSPRFGARPAEPSRERTVDLEDLPALAAWLGLDAPTFQAELGNLLAITRDRNRSLKLRAAITDAVHYLVSLRRDLTP